MECKEVRQYILNFKDDNINTEVNKHLNTCNSCGKLYNNITRTIDSFSLKNDASPFLYDKILNSINNPETKADNFFHVLRPYLLKTVYAILLTIIGIYVGILISEKKSSSTRDIFIQQMAKQMHLEIENTDESYYYIFY